MALARIASLGLLVLAACSSTPKARPQPELRLPPDSKPDWRERETYGFTPDNPIPVGGGPEGQHAFLGALRGPEGQPLAWRRLGSCCEFETPNGITGVGLLDMFEVVYAGQERSVILYLDMYDSGPVVAPTGFSLSEEGMLPEEGSMPAAEPAPEVHPRRPKVIEL